MNTVNIFRDKSSLGFEARVEILDPAHSFNMEVSLTPAGGGETLTLPRADRIPDLNIALRVMEKRKGFFYCKRKIELPDSKCEAQVEEYFTNLSLEDAQKFFIFDGYVCSSLIPSLAEGEAVDGVFCIFKEGYSKKLVYVLHEDANLLAGDFVEFFEKGTYPYQKGTIFHDSMEKVSLFNPTEVDVKVDIEGKESLAFSIPYFMDRHTARRYMSINGGNSRFIFPDIPELDKLFYPKGDKPLDGGQYTVFGSKEQKEAFKKRYAEGFDVRCDNDLNCTTFFEELITFESPILRVDVRMVKEGVVFNSEGHFEFRQAQ